MTRTVSWHCRFVAKLLSPHDNCAMISISRPGAPADLRNGWTHLLRLEFHDVGQWAGKTKFKVFDRKMAREIIKFIDALPKDVEHIYVHCFVGISRSAAVARFIKHHYGASGRIGGFFYNRHVLKTLLETTRA